MCDQHYSSAETLLSHRLAGIHTHPGEQELARDPQACCEYAPSLDRLHGFVQLKGGKEQQGREVSFAIAASQKKGLCVLAGATQLLWS